MEISSVAIGYRHCESVRPRLSRRARNRSVSSDRVEDHAWRQGSRRHIPLVREAAAAGGQSEPSSAGSCHRRQRAGQNSKFTKHLKDKVEVGSRLWGITAVAHGNIGARITRAGGRPAQRSRQRIESKPRRYAADAPCVGWNPASCGKSCRIALVIQDLDKRRPGKRERIADPYLEILCCSVGYFVGVRNLQAKLEGTVFRGNTGHIESASVRAGGNSKSIG